MLKIDLRNKYETKENWTWKLYQYNKVQQKLVALWSEIKKSKMLYKENKKSVLIVKLAKCDDDWKF